MSEDNVNKDNENADDVATLKEKLEKTENEKVALEMKLRESDDDLYSEDYLTFLQDKKEKKRSDGTSGFGGKISEYSEEQLQEMGTNNLPQLVKIIAGEVYTQIRGEDDRDKTKTERDAQKKRVAKARVEIKDFASKRPDFKEVAPMIKDLSDENPKLSLKQLYQLAGGKHPDGVKKEDPKKKDGDKTNQPPDTKPAGEGGMKKSDKNLSLREVIAEEWQKHK